MKTLMIIPTYNEAENLSPLLQAIFSYAPLTDVLIVDDHSPDGTGELADELQEKDMRVHVLHRAGKLGLGTAYLAGFKFALAHGYDAAFEMDADFSHDPRFPPSHPGCGRGDRLALHCWWGHAQLVCAPTSHQWEREHLRSPDAGHSGP
jgi:cellulose synthase/poly-beta-1,6-N-acetylglucosamine synthase-like glycosyltransferase